MEPHHDQDRVVIEVSSDSEPPSRTRTPESPPRGACVWRSDQFSEQECERYLDCPTHLFERPPSTNQHDAQINRSREDNEARESAHDPGSGAVSPLSEEEEGPPRTPSPDPDPIVSSRTASPSTGERLMGELQTAVEYPTRQEDNGTQNTVGDDSTPQRPGQRLEDSRASQDTAYVGFLDSNRAPGFTASSSQGFPTSQNQPLPNPLRQASTSGPSPGWAAGPAADWVQPSLPRWQEDAEATYCPICGTQFSFFVRKHHCRKCGRVVCASCSPHRITIPHQYIVEPPATSNAYAGGYLGLLNSDSGQALEGGRRVRLCNPCVPDPNTAPPLAAQGGHSRSQSNLIQPLRPEASPFQQRWSSSFLVGGAANGAEARGRSVTMTDDMFPRQAPIYPQQHDNRMHVAIPPNAAYSRSVSSTHDGLHREAIMRSMLDSTGYSQAGPSSRLRQPGRSLPPLPPQQPALAEEDECPVCHRELPRRTLPNYESLRESHIAMCIATHSAYGSRPSGQQDGENPLPQPPPRRSGMFPYKATEKDCVDSAECTICLEEFVVGVPMARLECLCRYHKACIDAWFVKNPGRCPIHQHDAFGF